MPILDRFKQGVDSAKFKADQLMRINRVQGEIGNLNHEIAGLRDKVANAVMELHKGGKLAHPELEELCASIDGLNGQIATKEAQIASIRAETAPQAPTAAPVILAPEYAAAAQPATSQPVAAAAPSPAPAPAPVAAANKCASCGFELPEKVSFCPNCGQRVTR